MNNIPNKFLTKKFFKSHIGEFIHYLVENGVKKTPHGVELKLWFAMFVADNFL